MLGSGATSTTALVDRFLGGFRERVHVARAGGQELVEGPGFVALIGRNAELLDGRVLVTDDRAVDFLGARLPRLFARVVNVFASAAECTRLLAESPDHRAEPATAMVSQDLGTIPVLDLPEGLTLHPVPIQPNAAGVSLEDAAAAALRSEPESAPTPNLAGFVAYLRAAPNARYLAATDQAGVVRGTAAAGVFGRSTGVFFVNTDPDWRGRGVGTAMTAAALRSAASAGAELAFLDASALGKSIYVRLGFQQVCETTLFVRDD